MDYLFLNMANSVPPANGVVGVTHVCSEQGGQSVTSPQNGDVSPVSCQLGKFLEAEPVALGTVEIMIGFVVLLFGIVTAVYPITLSLYSGVMFWGAIIYITAGSLTVKANKKLTPCLVKASLGMNILSTITAGIGIIMHSIDFILASYINGNCLFMICQLFLTRTQGIAGVMLVLSILEFFISIYVSAFACKATRRSGTEQAMYGNSQEPFSIPTSHVPTAPPNTSELTPSSLLSPAHNSTPEDLPPVYTEIEKF